MNRYGLRAQRYYARWAPKALAEISDPETFFTELGELIQGQVLLISQEMESTLDPTAPYLERVSQLRAVQRDAEEVAMTDNVYRLVLPELQGQEQLMQILGDLPSTGALEARADQLRESTQDDEGEPIPLTVEEEAAVTLLGELAALLPETVDVPEMDDRTVALHLERLTAFLSEHRTQLQELRIV